MYRHTQIQLYLLLILVILISGCTFNETKDDPITTENNSEYLPHEEIQYISKQGTYIISKNWEQIKLDSLLQTDDKLSILKMDAVFITTFSDSIKITLRNIYRNNPIIVFNEIDGPILTSLDRMNHYLLKPIQKESKIAEKTPSKSPVPFIKDTKVDTPILNEISSQDIPKLLLRYGTLSIPINSRELPKRQIVYISQDYPLIPNKKGLEIYFDNDFWDYTDYYYTNGIRLGYTHPVFANSPLSYLLVSNSTNGLDYYGLQIVQHMYTGSQPKVDTTIPGDRPWASYSVIGQYATSFDWDKKIKHESEINIGILGPKSGGGFLQDFVHTILPNNSPPEGWDNQIKTDIIIDYQYRIYKSLYEAKNFESYIKASVQGGSLRDNIKWGVGFKYGRFTPFYKDYQYLGYTAISRKLYYSIFGDIETQLIGYDATLQGGVTDRTSVYVIPTRNMERFVIQGYLGMEVSYKKMHLQFIQYWKSKEFKTGKDHKYVSVRLFIGF